MTHEKIKILISAYIDGEVTPSEKDIVEEHLSACPDCQKDYKAYKAMSSSLSKWSNETLSPDEEIKVQKRFEQRREPMFSKRTATIFATTLAMTLIIGSVVQNYAQKGLQARIHGGSMFLEGRLKSSADDMGDQYSDGNTNVLRKAYYPSSYMAQSREGLQKTQYQPYYMNSNYAVDAEKKDYNNKEQLRSRLVQNESASYNAAGIAGKAYWNGPTSEGYPATMGAIQAQVVSAPVGINAPFAEERKVITNEEMTLQVPDAEKTQNELDGLVSRYNGIIINFNINKLTDGSRSGLFVFKVLPKDLKNVLREVRRLGEVQAENQSGEDITDQYEYLQARMVNYEKSKEQLSKVLAKNLNNVDNNLTIQAQLAGVQSNIDSLASSIRQYDDQSYMATVVVNFFDVVKATEVKTLGFKEKFMKTVKDSFKSTLQTSYEVAINSFSGIFIIASFLFQILLWSLAFWGIYLFIKWMIKK